MLFQEITECIDFGLCDHPKLRTIDPDDGLDVISRHLSHHQTSLGSYDQSLNQTNSFSTMSSPNQFGELIDLPLANPEGELKPICQIRIDGFVSITKAPKENGEFKQVWADED